MIRTVVPPAKGPTAGLRLVTAGTDHHLVPGELFDRPNGRLDVACSPRPGRKQARAVDRPRPSWRAPGENETG